MHTAIRGKYDIMASVRSKGCLKGNGSLLQAGLQAWANAQQDTPCHVHSESGVCWVHCFAQNICRLEFQLKAGPNALAYTAGEFGVISSLTSKPASSE